MKLRLVLAAAAIGLSGAHANADAQLEREEMVELAWKRGCFNCHDVDTTIRGPAWVDVAERYRGDDSALERLLVKVRDGGSGEWGDDYMSPNKRVPETDIRKLLNWLLSLDRDAVDTQKK